MTTRKRYTDKERLRHLVDQLLPQGPNLKMFQHDAIRMAYELGQKQRKTASAIDAAIKAEGKGEK